MKWQHESQEQQQHEEPPQQLQQQDVGQALAVIPYRVASPMAGEGVSPVRAREIIALTAVKMIHNEKLYTSRALATL